MFRRYALPFITLLFFPLSIALAGETTFSPEAHMQAGPASDEKIVYASSSDGTTLNIFTINPDGSERQQLTFDEALNQTGPVWSPDRSQVAFYAYPGTGAADIYLMNADGSDIRNLTNTPDDDERAVAWSPDGSTLAFHSDRLDNNGSYDYEIYLLNLQDESLTQLTSSAGHDFGPAWSPDGRRLAYHSFLGDRFGIYSTAADGSDVQRLSPQDLPSAYFPAWSPDGELIAFHVEQAGYFQLYVMEADGSNSRPLMPVTMNDTFPDWSPDGEAILFQREIDNTSGIYRFTLVDDSVERITPAQNDYLPDWGFPAAPVSDTVAAVPSFTPTDESTADFLPTAIPAGELTATPTFSEEDFESAGPPEFADLRFALSPDGPPRTEFPVGTQEVFVIWNYENVPIDAVMRRAWTYDGAVIIDRSEAWRRAYGSSGTITDISLFDYQSPDGLPAGRYAVEISLNNYPDATLSGAFTIGDSEPVVGPDTAIRNLRFASSPDGEPQEVFPPGSSAVYAIWEYENMPADVQVWNIWQREGEFIIQQIVEWDTATYGAEGTRRDFALVDGQQGRELLPGNYEVEVSVLNAPSISATGSFRVEAPPTPTPVDSAVSTSTPTVLPLGSPTVTTGGQPPATGPLPQASARNPETIVRDGPGTNFNIISAIQPGESFTILGRYQEWYLLNVPASPSGLGWVLGSVIDISGDVSNLYEVQIGP